MVNLLYFILSIVAIIGGSLQNYSKKPFNNWSKQRKLYFTCWTAVAFISFVNGFRFFIDNPIFNFYAQFASGVQFMLIAFVPCGIDIFNKPWPIRLLRDVAFIAIGIAHILLAFSLKA
jgi:hypothetical protein